ncbi:hypothetical protein EAF04_001356 [Stromatinia cepivora]|nr:hypothetical protein EAF04_001356 [Stromatinia cepivora]
MPTILQCLTNCPNVYYTYVSNASVSRKASAMQYHLLNRRFYASGSEVLSEDRTIDSTRYNRFSPALLSAVPSEVHNEGDVRRVFAYITSWIEKAFGVVPKVWHRWETSPPGLNAHTAEKIDTWWGMYIGQHQRCAAIGELKRPGIISIEQWQNPYPGADANILGKEIRMYAHQYKCPQTFYFDGNYLLVMRFEADSVDDICEENCVADWFFLGKESLDIPYWIDRLIAEGLERLRAELAGRVVLDGYERMFRFYDGKPFWLNGGDVYWDHPGGYTRRFIGGEWWWYLGNTAQVRDTPRLV